MKYIGIIYKRTCTITNKSYIGQTSCEDERNRDWNNLARDYSSSGSKIDRARRKYGPENFSYEVIVRISSHSKENITIVLDILEKVYIKRYNTVKDGYNTSHGGHSYSRSNHGFQKPTVVISARTGKFIGRFSSMADAAREINVDPIDLRKCIQKGRHIYKEFVVLVENYSSAELKLWLDEYYRTSSNKSIVQLDRFSGALIKIFENVESITKLLNFSKSKIISCCRRDDVTVSEGYRWMYFEDYIKQKPQLKSAIKIVQLSMDGELISSFQNINLFLSGTEKLSKTNKDYINSICIKNRDILRRRDDKVFSLYSGFGFIWMYEPDYESVIKDNLNIVSKNDYRIVRFSDGESDPVFYENPKDLMEREKLSKFNLRQISLCCNNRREGKYLGYFWKWKKDLSKV